ncbi:MAG: hypothetical protein C4519_05570 [Desulfobacteraceae bacterium]|nr:MAG: hypothetical protein C4519_05570 [Desulfobacteraceae bacterium]
MGNALGAAWHFRCNTLLGQFMESNRDLHPEGETMKLAQSKKVKDVVRPPIDGLPCTPAVGMFDSLTQAVELMLENNRQEIAVSGRSGIIGCIRLEDALHHLGLRLPKPLATFGEKIKD